MKMKSVICAMSHSLKMVSAFALVLQLGLLAGSAQTNIYFYTGSETNISLPRGTYDITAYGAQGGNAYHGNGGGGLGAEMEGQFYFTERKTLTILVGGAGGDGGPAESAYDNSGGGGGGGGSFVVGDGFFTTPLVIAGGGGGGGEEFDGYSALTGTNGGLGDGFYGYTGASGGSGGSAGDAGGGGGFNSSGGSGTYENGEDSGYGGKSFYDGGDGGGSGSFGAGGSGGYGGGGGGGFLCGGGGGGYSGGEGAALFGGGGGGGSIIDSSAITNLTEVSGIGSPDDSPNGEIIITKVSLHIATASLMAGTNRVAYYQELEATGGTPPYYWSLSWSRLPLGLQLSSRGAISGTPMTTGTFVFEVRVTDSSYASVVQPFKLIVKKNSSPIPPLYFH
jgi:hypothetical protein